MTRPTLLLLLALLSCAPAAPPRPAVAPAAVPSAPPAPQLTATATASRVVLMSFDGLGADALARQHGLTTFERLARDGASARVIPGNPKPADPDLETIVEAARRQGKRVGAVPSRTTADFGLAWSEPVVQGRTIKLKREDFKREWVPPGWTAPPQRRPSFSPVMRTRVEWAVPEQARIDVDLVAYDRTDDQVENYDALYLESGGFETSPDAQGWFTISMRTRNGLHGSWSKLLHADARLHEVELYWGPISRNQAYPSSFLALIEEEAGFWPGAPDDRLDPVTFSEQMVRLSEFLTRVQSLAIRRMPFDLLLLDQPIIDEAVHTHLGRNDQVVRDAFIAADRAADAIAKVLDPARDALIITGDRELNTVLLAIGPGVPKGAIGDIVQTRIARFVAVLLGVEVPAEAE